VCRWTQTEGSSGATSSRRRDRSSPTWGATVADVVKVTVYLVDIDDRTRINPVRQEVFGDVRPASTLVEVSALAIPGAKLEVEAVALVP
jgi:enamine deaminase RidA (YjgF/YER057c/UK114 family)